MVTKVNEIYLMLELRKPRLGSDIYKIMESKGIDGLGTRRLINNLSDKRILEKGVWLKLTDLGMETLEDHIDKILSKL